METKTFIYEEDDIKIEVVWWAKDFQAMYKSKFGLMSYGLHMLYMIPKEYTEKQLMEMCRTYFIEWFRYACGYLEKHPEFLESFKKEYLIFKGENQKPKRKEPKHTTKENN